MSECKYNNTSNNTSLAIVRIAGMVRNVTNCKFRVRSSVDVDVADVDVADDVVQ